MGGMQVLEWGVMFPERVRSLVAMSTALAASAQQIAWWSTGRRAIRLDPRWRGGDYYDAAPGDGPSEGLAIARMISQITFRSDDVFTDRFGREVVEPLDGFALWQRFEVERYLEYHGDKLARRFDANSYLLLTKAMDLHDLGRGRGGIEAATERITAPTLSIGVSSDILYPPYQQRDIADLLGNASTSRSTARTATTASSSSPSRWARRWRSSSRPSRRTKHDRPRRPRRPHRHRRDHVWPRRQPPLDGHAAVGVEQLRDGERRRQPPRRHHAQGARVLQPLRQPDRERVRGRRRRSKARRRRRRSRRAWARSPRPCWRCARPGDHIVAQRQTFSTTQLLFGPVCARFGIETTIVDGTDAEAIAAAVQPNRTRMIFVETPTNPLMQLVDLEAVGAIVGPIKVVDSTFAGPMITRPHELGFDLVVHSATKSLAGHNDATLGVVAGERDLISWIWSYHTIHGATASPFDALNGLRGIRTLGVRVRQQSASAQRIAEVLEDHPKVTAVHYPGLDSHPQRDLAKRQMALGGGVLSFEVAGGWKAGRTVAEALRLAHLAPSLGGPETLVTHVASTTAANLTPEERAAMGIGDGLIRLSVGLEDVDDLIADVQQALDRV